MDYPGDVLNVKSKVLKYEEFLNEKLRGDLLKCLETRDKACEQLANYLQLKEVIQLMIKNEMTNKPLRTQVDLGCNFYMQAKVYVDLFSYACRPDPSKIFINIGLGYHLEFPLSEAVTYIDKRIEKLNTHCDNLAEDAARIKAHIKLVLEGLRELQSISADDAPKQHRTVW